MLAAGEVYVMEKLCVTAVVTLLWAEAVAGASRARHSLVSFVWSDLFQQSHSPARHFPASVAL